MIILILFFLISANESFLSPLDNETEIFVIGTVHFSSNNYNSDTLLNILNEINPDVILVECDSSYMTVDFQLKEDIRNSFLETRAITKYQLANKVDLRPYDITGRDSFLNNHDRRVNEANFFNDVRMLSRNENVDNSVINILNKILTMMNTADVMSNSNAMYINSEGSRNIDSINYYTYEGLNTLINSASELSFYKSYWDAEYSYWNTRNKVMLENILHYKNAYEGKKIVVLCGFAHKNILKTGLEEKATEENILVKEFWEID